MPWALVELDANQRDGLVPPIQLQFLGRQRFTQSRKPNFKPAGFTPRSRASPHPAPPRTILAPASERPQGDTLHREALRQGDLHQNVPAHAVRLQPFPPIVPAHGPEPDRGEVQPSQRGRTLIPVKPTQHQPSPRCVVPAFPTLQLPGTDDGAPVGAMRSARRGAAFTPRSQAQEDAKVAHRRSMVNGSMKKLM